jgi:hypothetical protein
MVPVDMDGGLVHVEWDPQASVTGIGQFPFSAVLRSAGIPPEKLAVDEDSFHLTD